MKQESKRLTSILLATLLIAGALVVYFELIVPAYTNLESVKGQAESENVLYQNETQVATQIKGLLASYQSDSSSSQLVAMSLPVGPDVAGALAQIYGIGANTGVTIQGTAVSLQAVQEQAPSDDGTTSGGIADAATGGSIVKPLGTVSFQVTASGSYESLKSFLQGLESNIRLFDVTAITFQPSDTGVTPVKGQTLNPDSFNYTITVVTYYQAP
ncbi:MAG TPA: hypothetical protein VMA75_04620 [Candidatus Paceibacterota bacterium]|nr:hypothetical protein [Candidatus Paceibacterota bacterium]